MIGIIADDCAVILTMMFVNTRLGEIAHLVDISNYCLSSTAVLNGTAQILPLHNMASGHLLGTWSADRVIVDELKRHDFGGLKVDAGRLTREGI